MNVAGTHNEQTVEPRGRLSKKPVAPVLRGVMKGIVCAAVLYGFSAAPALALGLGEVTPHSALGQPFTADVKLIGVNGDTDLRCFKVNLASMDGDRLGSVTFTVNDSDGTPRLYVGTREAVGEPAVQLSVEYNCATQTRRDYQILLDPETSPLAIKQPVVPASKPAPGPAVTPLAPMATSGDAAGAPPKKTRHHRDGDAAPVPLAAVKSTEVASAAPLKGTSALEKKRAKQAAKVFRNVLRLGDDATVDDNLNGVDSLHLSLSHGLKGENSDLNTKAPLPGNATQANAAAQAGAASATAAAGGAPAAVVPDADAQLKELQAKIDKLEAQTEELKKLNAKQMADLEAAKKTKEAQGNELYLYLLLLVCIVAIAWLVWRSRQIQTRISHSWEEVLPEEETPAEPASRYRTNPDDDLFDEPKPKAKPAPRQEAKPAAPVSNEIDFPLDEEPAAPVPAPAPRKDDFLATLAAPRVEETESGEGEYKFLGNVRQSLPDAEEILDEIQQAEFWMDMQQPQRAIEILESNWGSERPSSPLPWLYLFDLYRMVDDQAKYVELTERFERIFNGKVIPWEEKDLLQHQRGLEDFPVLLKKITQLWGSDQIVPFMENLLIDDRDGRRQGFDLNAYRDILFLANIAYEIGETEGPVANQEINAPDWSVLNH